MKVSDFSLTANPQDSGITGPLQFPRECRSIPQIFRQTALDHPDRIAVSLGQDRAVDLFASPFASKSLTYAELDSRSDRLAAMLRREGALPGSVVGVMLDSSIDLVSCLLAILKSGSIYLPLSPSAPIERNRFLLRDSGAKMLIFDPAQTRIAGQLQWECPALQAIFCPASNDIRKERESANELMKPELWDYVAQNADDRIQGGGWKNSYTGEYFSGEEMDEYAANVRAKLAPLVTPSSRVLEIGCASGITLCAIAPLVGQYVATDLAPAMLRIAERESRQLGLRNVCFRHVAADEADSIPERDFDLIILNSVVQSFNGANYFRHVLRQLIHLAAPQAHVFLGDLMDTRCKDEFSASLEEFARANIGRGYTTKNDLSLEMFVSPTFLEDLPFEFPEIHLVSHSRKIGLIENELVRYRFDTLLEVDKTRRTTPSGTRNKRQLDRTDIGSGSPGAGAAPGAEDVACLIYTSGTTGTPKGVLVEHGGLVNTVLDQITRFGILPDDRVLQFASPTFDACLYETLIALLSGAALVTVDPKIRGDGEAFVRFVNEQGITMATLPPSFLRALRQPAFEHLRILVSAGEPANRDDALHYSRSLDFYNAYGPTEAAICACVHRVDPHASYEGQIPIGEPIANTECRIVDSSLNPKPDGIFGELCLSGAGLGRGYINDSELTAHQFVRDPSCPSRRLYRTGDRARRTSAGVLEFGGRIDDQVKVRGFRIEPGEIEAALARMPHIVQCVAVPCVEDGACELAVYFTATGALAAGDIRAHLRAVLPEYMIPAYFVQLDSLPLTAHGKVNRRLLPDPKRCQDTARTRAPQTATEEAVARIWSEVLGQDDFSTDANFFELGGNSLKVIMLYSRLSVLYPGAVKVNQLYSFPTVAHQAKLLQPEDGKAAEAAAQFEQFSLG